MTQSWLIRIISRLLRGPRGITNVLCVATMVLAVLPMSNAVADVESVMPDFYAEPDVGPFRKSDSDKNTEFIDPFTGTLTLRYVDLSIPGDGGLDINIVRTYTSAIHLTRKIPTNNAPFPTDLLPTGPTGVGWTIHFGRVVKADDSGFGICHTNDADPNDDTRNNPILELPSGERQILASHNFGAPNRYTFETKQLWAADCIGDGLLVLSPEGVKYTFDHHVVSFDEITYTTRKNHAWYPTRIEDRNGNFLTFTYYPEQKGSHALIQQITSSDDRLVDFTYVDRGTGNARLTGITANGQTWQYQYTPISGGTYQLTRVVRPDGLTWEYAYYDETQGPGRYGLQTVTHPYGGTVTYDYEYVDFSGLVARDSLQYFYSVAVKSKINGGRDVTPGTWTYSYTPGVAEDVTSVVFPGGKHVYKHFGVRGPVAGYSPGFDAGLWQVGLLKEKQTYDVDENNNETLVHQELFSWSAPYVVSNEDYYRPPYNDALGNDVKDLHVRIPQLDQKTIIRDGTTYQIQYLNYDNHGHPQQTIETGQLGTSSEVTRTTDLTWYQTSRDQHIFNQIQDEELQGEAAGKNVYRTFDVSNGDLLSLNNRGVTENFTYHPSGDLKTKTNARGKVWTYNDYHRGLPRQVNAPESVSASRVVNDTGTVASQTDGRGNATAYSYDDLNRPTLIDHPLGDNVAVAWDATSRTVTRGLYSQTTTFDGFGKPICVNTAGVYQRTDYDVRGNPIFMSHPSNDPCSLLSAGTDTTYDVLNRVTEIKHSDNTTRTFEYSIENKTRVTNERNFPTTYTYRSYRDPDNTADKVLMRIDASEGISTVFTRNILGQIQTVTIGGVTRSHTYDQTNNFLIGRFDPEIGTTSFGRDDVGNMISRQVGTSGTTTYIYDGLNRLRNIDYPDPTPDVVREYDDNGNLTRLASGNSEKTYVYDANDNLDSETHIIDGQTYAIDYAYNGLDFLDTVTYPSGRVVTYAPDNLGRPTQVMPFVSNVSFHPNGQPSSLLYANSTQTTITLSPRLWPERLLTTGTGSLVDLTYGYDGLGNPQTIDDALDPASDRTLTYDGVDRLTGASGVWGSGTITYDPMGNINSKNIGGESLSYTYGVTSNQLTAISGSSNLSFAFDVYGNVIANGVNTMSYDDASNLRTVSGPANISNEYDGDHLRVRRQKDGVNVSYIYTQNGQLLGEYDDTGFKFKEYAYLGSRLVAVADTDNDTDDDSLLDSWEEQYFGNLTQGPNDDPDGDGVSNLQEYQEGTNPAVPEVPQQVVGLSAQADDGQVTLSWSSAVGAISYNLYWSNNPGVTVATGNKIANVTSPYVHSALTNNTPYYYIVTAHNTAGESAGSQEVLAIPGVRDWRFAMLVEPDETGDATLPKVAADAMGNVVALWQQHDGSQNNIWVNHFARATGWSTPQLLESDSGDAINPDIVMNDNGRAITVWRQYDGTDHNTYASRYVPGNGWAAPILLESLPGSVNSPRVGIDATGNGAVTWSQSGSVYVVHYDSIVGWGIPYELATGDSNISHFGPIIAMDAGGNITVAWQQYISAFGNYSLEAARYEPTVGWSAGETLRGSPETQVFVPFEWDIAASDNGDATVTWRDFDYQTSRATIESRRYDGLSEAWESDPIVIDNPNEADSDLPTVAMDNAGNAIATWQQFDGMRDNIWSNRYQYGVGWSVPELIETDNSGAASEPEITVNDAGKALVVWLHSDGARRNVIGNIYTPLAGWQTPITLEPLAGDSDNPRVAIGNGGDGMAVWQQLAGTRWDIQSNPVTTPYLNQVPSADAGPDQTVYENEMVTLDGTSSYDLDGTLDTYAWTQISGRSVTLSGANTAVATFTAPEVAVDELLQFQLTVTDDDGASDVDTVVVTDKESDADGDGLHDQWEIQYFGDLSAGPNDDPDGDNASNLTEFQLGTDPTVADPPPGVVTSIAAYSGDGEATITWDSVPDASSYTLYWSTSPGVTVANGTPIPNAASPYTHTGLTNDTVYYYIVTAVNVFGESSPSTEVNVMPTLQRHWTTPVRLDVDPSGAGEPVVALDDQGHAAVTWREDVTGTTGSISVWANSYDPNSGWSTATVVDDSNKGTRDPHVAISNGKAVVVWSQDASNDQIWSNTYSAASGWAGASRISDRKVASRAPMAAVAPNGDALALFNTGELVVNEYTDGAGWADNFEVLSSAPTLWGNSYPELGYQAVVADASLNWTVVWQESTGLWSVRKDSMGGWLTPNLLSANNFRVSLDPNGKGVGIRLELSGTDPRKIYALHFDAIAGQSTERLITDTIPYIPGGVEVHSLGVASAPDGTAIAVWAQKDPTTSIYNSLWASYYQSTTGWSSPMLLETGDDEIEHDSIRVVIDDSGNAVVAWVQQESLSGPLHVWVRSYLVDAGWTLPVILDAGVDYAFEVSLAMANNGDAIAAWVQVDDPDVLASDIWASRYVFASNSPPTANAGPDQTVDELTTVNLDGTGSNDSDGAISSYTWVQVAGPPVSLNGPDTATPSFTAPDVTADTPLTFELTVTDDQGATGVDSVNVSVQDAAGNTPPIADAGPDQTVDEGVVVALDGSGSSDSDGTIISYAWVQTDVPEVTLSDPAAVSPTFTAPEVTTDTVLTFELTVTDDGGATGVDTVNITVQDTTGGGDTTPPVTTSSITKTTNGNQVTFDITLTADEPATTWFRVTGTFTITSGGANTSDWQVYSGPIQVQKLKKDKATLEYYSIDTAGNQEATHSEALK